MHAIYENHYLSDKDVANFARQSFAKLAEQFTPEQNSNLIRFLARGMKSGDWNALLHKMTSIQNVEEIRELAVYLRNIPEHWVPFGHPHISLRMSAPIPIRTQCYKHKIGYVESEESRRYIKSEPVLFIPEHFRSIPADIKQGSSDEPHCNSDYWKARYVEHCNKGIAMFLEMVRDGVCPEQARFNLPQGVEVNWLWTGSLYAYANFYNQRKDSHAQKEIQDLAKQAGEIIAPLYPVSWAALTQGAY